MRASVDGSTNAMRVTAEEAGWVPTENRIRRCLDDEVIAWNSSQVGLSAVGSKPRCSEVKETGVTCRTPRDLAISGRSGADGVCQGIPMNRQIVMKVMAGSIADRCRSNHVPIKKICRACLRQSGADGVAIGHSRGIGGRWRCPLCLREETFAPGAEPEVGRGLSATEFRGEVGVENPRGSP